MPHRLPLALILAALACALSAPKPVRAAEAGKKSPGRKYSSIERSSRERLAAAHADVERIKASRKTLAPLPNLNDYRAILHAHAEDAEHTGGTRPEMLEDAKRAGVSAIMLTDHFRPPKDFIEGSWRGLKDGVLFIPGSETHGFLIYPVRSVMDKMELPKEEFIKAIGADEGLLFLSHIEERKEHPMTGLDGMEIYNRHADAKDETPHMLWLMSAVTDPAQAAKIAENLKDYPAEMLATQLDYPMEYMEKWDAELAKGRVTGVAANDCHHNQVFIVKMVDENSVRIGTIVDKDEGMRVFTAEQRPGIKAMTAGRKPGDILVRLDFDPYYQSFLNVSTHILAPELTEWSIREALAQGRAYVSHDWMCDPTGFKFLVMRSDPAKTSEKKVDIAGVMGQEVKFAPGLSAFGLFPVACKMRLLKDGKPIASREGDMMSQALDGPGVYRLEGWLTVDGEDRPWIYSNPIYVRQ